MIKRYTQITDSVEVADVDISRTPDFRGNQIEPNSDFTIFSNSREPQYRESSDRDFRTDIKYIMKSNNRRKPANPKRLELYEYNGINYILSKDESFKDKQYYKQHLDGFIEANPRNCQLEEEMAPLYSYYDVAFLTANGPIQILHFDGSDFDKAKEAFDWCVQNRDAIRNEYQDAIDFDIDPKKAIINYIAQNSPYIEERKGQNYSVRTNTAQRTTATRRSNRTTVPFGDPNIVNAVLEKYELTPDRLDPRENRDMTPTEKKAQREAFGYNVYYKDGKYIINPLREPNTILGSHILNSYEFKNNWYSANTIDELLKKVKVLQQILQDFKDHKINREDMLKKLDINDSVKPNKLSDSYKSLEEAQLADDEKLLTKYASLGIYKDESDNKFLVKPKDNDGKLIRIGKFGSLLEAQNAAMAFMNSEKDINKFFETDFYKNHTEECKEAYEYYKKDYSTERKIGDPYVSRNEEGTFDVKYLDNDEEVVIASNIPTEARAKVVAKEALKSGNVKEYAENFKKTNKDIVEVMEETGIDTPVTSNAQTYSTNKGLGNAINALAKDIPVSEAYDLLSGYKEQHGKIYLNVIDKLKEKLTEAGFEEVELFANDYGNQFDFQKVLENKVIDDLIEKGIPYVANEVIANINDIASYGNYSEEDKANRKKAVMSQEQFILRMINYIKRNITFKRHTYDQNNQALANRIATRYIDFRRTLRNLLNQ